MILSNVWKGRLVLALCSPKESSDSVSAFLGMRIKACLLLLGSAPCRIYMDVQAWIRGGGGGCVTPPALDHQFFFSTNFLSIAQKKRFYGRYVP